MVLLSKEVQVEIERTLLTKFPKFAGKMEELAEIFEQRIDMVQLGSIQIDASRDEDDNRVLETAVIGNADYIVTGDKDLLVLGHFDEIPICNPADFIEKV